MAEITTQLKRIHAVLNSTRANMVTITIIGLVVYISMLQTSHFFAPRELNHVVLINMRDSEYGSEIRITQKGEVNWTEELQGGIGDGRGQVSVCNIGHAFTRGAITLIDSADRQIASIDIVPPGRYCGELVIVLLPNMGVRHEFRKMPEGTVCDLATKATNE